MNEIIMETMLFKTPSLAIVVPCYNEKDAFPYCLDGLTTVLSTLISKGKIRDNSYVLFVDDGSKLSLHHVKALLFKV